MNSFWLILKQQWTIKNSSPFFLFLAWRPSWLEVGITGHNFGRGLSKNHSTKVWFKLAQWLQRSWLKCEKLTDGRMDGRTDRRRTTDDRRRTLSGDNSSLWVRWAKKLQNFSYQNQDRHSQILRNQINKLFTTEEGRQALAYCHIHNLFQVTFMSVMIQNWQTLVMKQFQRQNNAVCKQFTPDVIRKDAAFEITRWVQC